MDDELQKLNQELVDVSSELLEVSNKLQPLFDQQNKLFSKKKALAEQIDHLKYQTLRNGATNGLPLTEEELALILIGDSRSTEEYKAAESIIENKLSLRRRGYNPDTGQTSFDIKLYKNNPEITEKTFNDIKLLLPYIEPITYEKLKKYNSYDDESNNKGVRFSIFEHTLSEGGIYNLLITHTCVYIVLTKYSKVQVFKSFENLEMALKHIQQHHWYEKTFGKCDFYSDDEDDNDENDY